MFDIAKSLNAIVKAENEELQKLESLAKESEAAKQKETEEERKTIVAKATKLRTWMDATGRFRVTAKFVRRSEESVFLEKEDGAIVEVPIEKLSNTDKKLLEDLRRVSE